MVCGSATKLFRPGKRWGKDAGQKLGVGGTLRDTTRRSEGGVCERGGQKKHHTKARLRPFVFPSLRAGCRCRCRCPSQSHSINTARCVALPRTHELVWLGWAATHGRHTSRFPSATLPHICTTDLPIHTATTQVDFKQPCSKDNKSACSPTR